MWSICEQILVLFINLHGFEVDCVTEIAVQSLQVDSLYRVIQILIVLREEPLYMFKLYYEVVTLSL